MQRDSQGHHACLVLISIEYFGSILARWALTEQMPYVDDLHNVQRNPENLHKDGVQSERRGMGMSRMLSEPAAVAMADREVDGGYKLEQPRKDGEDLVRSNVARAALGVAGKGVGWRVVSYCSKQNHGVLGSIRKAIVAKGQELWLVDRSGQSGLGFR